MGGIVSFVWIAKDTERHKKYFWECNVIIRVWGDDRTWDTTTKDAPKKNE